MSDVLNLLCDKLQVYLVLQNSISKCHRHKIQSLRTCVTLTANQQVQNIRLTVDIDNPVHNLNDSWKDIVYHNHQILVMCSSFL